MLEDAFMLMPVSKRRKIRTSSVFETYWHFAALRQDIFFARAAKFRRPWTADRILQEYKFTNAYRAADRVSQFLIREVIGSGSNEASELFFRIILFKTFNKIETWQFLKAHLGELNWEDYRFDRYSRALERAKQANGTIYSAAYIMPPGERLLGFSEKHKSHLRLLELMMKDDVPEKLVATSSMKEAYQLLLQYPTIGPFLAFQYVTDLNYSDLTDFSEMSFVVPGPGAKRGLRKCFTDPGKYSESDLIRLVADTQHQEFARRDIKFKDLWGRSLQLVDCQNLFCEIDKYSRVKHPEFCSGPRRIKQRFHSTGDLPKACFPEKWRIGDAVENWYASLTKNRVCAEGLQ